MAPSMEIVDRERRPFMEYIVWPKITDSGIIEARLLNPQPHANTELEER
jgi:hypothetical protein